MLMWPFNQEKGEELKGDQKRTIVISLAGAVIASALAVITSGLSASLPFISLAFAINIAFISDRVSRFNFENKTEKELTKVVSHMSDLHYLGDSETGARWFLKNYHGATRVMNTVFNRSNSVLQPRLGLVIPDMVKIMKKAIEDGCSWTDIYIPSEEPAVFSLHATISDKNRHFHVMKRLDCDVPLLQVLLLEYSPEKRITLFGWGFSGSANSRVYKTEDQSAFTFFETYFEKLNDKSQLPIYTSPPARPTRLSSINNLKDNDAT